MSDVLCSVVVPTFGRPASLHRALSSLAAQTADHRSFETVVVVDGPDRDSSRLLELWESERRLPNLSHHVIDRCGAAGARNFGCDRARSPVVLFLDDDMEADAALVATHQAHHRAGRRIAVLGDCPIFLGERPPAHLLRAWAWWEQKLHDRCEGSSLPRYTDFCTGNVSLRVADFREVGGFDPDFRGYGLEDYELGWRLLDAGIGFVADRSARADHHHNPTLWTSLVRHRAEGRAEVLLGSKHTILRPGLRLMSLPRGGSAWTYKLAFGAPAAGDLLASAATARLEAYEKLSKRRRWAQLYEDLRAYWFWRGVASALGSLEELFRFQAAAPPPPTVQVDLAEPLPDPDELRPAAARGVPVDVEVSLSGRPVTVVRVGSSIGDRKPLRKELLGVLAADPAARLALGRRAAEPALRRTGGASAGGESS
jgi:GT2 family glycosyltransferase